MIYKDQCAGHDKDYYPCERPDDKCLNCGKTHGEHQNWACPGNKMLSGYFSQQTEHTRYLTQSMKDSIAVATPSPKFKIGDRVKVNANNWGGATGTVVSDSMHAWDSPLFVCVHFDPVFHKYSNHDDYHGFKLDEVELIGSTSQVSHSQPAVRQNKNDHQELVDFFRATQPGQCACGLVKETNEGLPCYFFKETELPPLAQALIDMGQAIRDTQ